MTPADKYPVTVAPNQGWDDRILVCHCGEMVDNFIIVAQRYVILVDTMLNPATARMMLAIAEQYLQNGRQLLVINSHADWDHCWGNQLFNGPTAVRPTPIIATRRCRERLLDVEAAVTLAELRNREPGIYEEVIPTPPTIVFDGELLIDAGDMTLRLFATPGHQPDHLSIFIPEISTLLPGDAAETPFPFALSAATLPQIRESLRKLAALNARTVLYCHAPVTAGPGVIQDNIQYFDRLEQQCREAIARGVLPTNEQGGEAELVSLRAVLPPELDLATVTDFYKDGHRAHIRMMMEYLQNTQ